MRIDISGNWIWTDAPECGLIVSQPNPPSEGNLFYQDLVIPAGSCCLHIIYKADLDHSYGKAVFGNFESHSITVNGIRYEISLTEDEDSDGFHGTIRFVHDGGALHLETRVQDTHCFNSTLLPTALHILLWKITHTARMRSCLKSTAIATS